MATVGCTGVLRSGRDMGVGSVWAVEATATCATVEKLAFFPQSFAGTGLHKGPGWHGYFGWPNPGA